MTSAALHRLVDAASASHRRSCAVPPAAPHAALGAGGAPPPPPGIKSDLLDAALAMAAADAIATPQAPPAAAPPLQPVAAGAAGSPSRDAVSAAAPASQPLSSTPPAGFAALLAGDNEQDGDSAPDSGAPALQPAEAEAASGSPAAPDSEGPRGPAQGEAPASAQAAEHPQSPGDPSAEALPRLSGLEQQQPPEDAGPASAFSGRPEEGAPPSENEAGGADEMALVDLDNMQLGDMSALLGDSDGEQRQDTLTD